MTRDELDNVVEFTRRFADELEIVPDRGDGGTVDLVDAREGDEARDDDDRGDHPSISPEMIGLPTATSDLLPRRRRFWLRTLPAVTEPHVEAATPDPDPPADGAPGGRPDLSGFRLPGTRAPRATTLPVAPRGESLVDSPRVEPLSPPVADDAAGRPDRRARRRSRHTRAVVVSSFALVLLTLAVVISVLTLVVG